MIRAYGYDGNYWWVMTVSDDYDDVFWRWHHRWWLQRLLFYLHSVFIYSSNIRLQRRLQWLWRWWCKCVYFRDIFTLHTADVCKYRYRHRLNTTRFQTWAKRYVNAKVVNSLHAFINTIPKIILYLGICVFTKNVWMKLFLLIAS